MKQKLKKWLYVFTLWGIKGALLLCMSVSCKKESLDISCPKGTCCGSEEGKYRFTGILTNVKAALGQNAYFVLENGDVPLICPYQFAQFSNYENSYPVGGKTVYTYRIWGRTYNCDACPTLIAGPVPQIVIDRIEKIN